jgi:hypothetical protein
MTWFSSRVRTENWTKPPPRIIACRRGPSTDGRLDHSADTPEERSRTDAARAFNPADATEANSNPPVQMRQKSEIRPMAESPMSPRVTLLCVIASPSRFASPITGDTSPSKCRQPVPRASPIYVAGPLRPSPRARMTLPTSVLECAGSLEWLSRAGPGVDLAGRVRERLADDLVRHPVAARLALGGGGEDRR